MPQTVNVPGVGQLQFPDGMSQPDMAAAIQRNFPQLHQQSPSNQIPGNEQALAGNRNVGKPDESSFLDKVTGGIEAARALVTGATTGAVGYIGGALGGVASSISNGEFGTMEGVRRAKEAAEQGAASLTYEPKTAKGQQYTEAIGNAINDSGIMGVPIPELDALARSANSARVTGGVLARANSANIDATRAAALEGKTIPPLVAGSTIPAINYDVPAYVRNGVKPPPEIAGPPNRPAVVAPVLPEATRAAAPTPLESYAAAPIKSPYGELFEPALPEVATLESALDAYANKPAGPNRPAAPHNQFDDMLREAGLGAAAPKSPLESMLAGEAVDTTATKLAAALRDTSDIDAILQQFGVFSPEPAAPPAIPAPTSLRTVERATSPAAPIDAGLRVPETIRGPVEPTGAVERAVTPAAPLDNSMVAPEPTAGSPTAQARPVSEIAAASEPFVATPERHVDPAQRGQHLQVLREVGLDNIRESAVTGDVARAAREFQHGKFTSEPAGQFWFDQFQRETDAMKGYTQRLVDDTKGRTGLDGESLEHKGRDIAAPYDAARGYFEKAKQNLYDIADKENGGMPLKSTEHIDNLLVDREFNNTALADKTLDLVEAVKRQFDLHKERNGGSLTVKEAESFRKWLNKRWTPENSKIVGSIKDALDEDVFASAGQDVYAAARQMHQLEKRTLDDPNGISKLMDSDPHAPMNRSTPYEAIPNALVKLSNEQFRHIINTYRDLPPELQPMAQQAIATLKAHYAERLQSAGAETAHGNGRQLWNAGGVKKFAADNSAKLPMLFDADELGRINTLLKAGDILRVNPAYPGAAAQVANASKAGLMSTLLGKAGGGIGGAAGAAIAGPFGAGAGGLAGDALAGQLSRFAGERKALAEAKKAIVSEHSQAKPRSPVEEWEAEARR